MRLRSLAALLASLPFIVATAPPAEAQDMEGMDHGQMAGMGMEPAHEAGEARPVMTGALGPYPINREASGTAWQPDTSEHRGIHIMSGGWMLMGHALLNGVYDWQSGRRGDDTAFVSGMVMGMGERSFADGSVLQLRAMLSPDPLMGKSGYPLLLALGETADGVTPLRDRQHPHDLFMELSASYSLHLSEQDSVFLYGGLPGEPAFGPPAFMHRLSIMDSPEAPITHHWLDSTHISFGVLTAGLVHGAIKFEGSRFNGREPDQHRYDIETGPLDSTALRLSWNPARTIALQASWARLKSPEQLEPERNQTRWSASAIYTRPLRQGDYWSTTLAWGRRSSGSGNLDAWALESAAKLGAVTVFGRGELVHTDELAPGPVGHGALVVGKASLGIVRDFPIAGHVSLGLGGLYVFDFVPHPLKSLYGGDPEGAMAFLRLKID